MLASHRLAAPGSFRKGQRYATWSPARQAAIAGTRSPCIGALERLPHTLCHLDAFRPNLLSATEPRGVTTVALDWSFVGYGALGVEIGHLVSAGLVFGWADVYRAPEAGDAVVDEYLAGLHEVGWRGDPRLVRLGYTTGAALRWGQRAPKLDLDAESPFELHSLDASQVASEVERRAAVTYYLLNLADEARALLD